MYRATVDKGANLLLDLAPDRTGRIPDATAARLMDMKAAVADPALIRPSLAAGATLAFAPTTGRYVRLNVLEADGAPTFWDFGLYGHDTGQRP